jgi:hypothetical protein
MSAIAPARPADHELFGEGSFERDLIPVHPSQILFEEIFVEAMPDEVYPRGWWAAKIWTVKA